MARIIPRLFFLITLAIFFCHAGTAAEEHPPPPSPGAAPDSGAAALFATVGDKAISAAEFELAANNAAKQKFYHGQPPQAEIDGLMREVADRLINRILLTEEAGRRHTEADTAQVAASIATYEERYAQSPAWQQHKDQLLPGLRLQLEQDSKLQRLEAEVRQLPPPTDEEILGYFNANRDKFVEPEKLHLSMILLQVAPSSPGAAWSAAEEEAARLVAKLNAGADFADSARLQSADDSAKEGGDLGYVHRGMIPEGLQGGIDRMSPGEISAPIRVLQGMTVFKLIERQPARQLAFEVSKPRARDLYVRERSDQVWNSFLAQLRSKAKIEINTQRYPALVPQDPGSK